MGLFKRRDKQDEAQAPARALLAAAMPLSGTEGRQAWNASSGDAGWQRQAWYFYDAIGELRFAFNWLASAGSRATLYAAEIDPETGLITGPTEDPRARAVAAAILGGADDRPQLQSTMLLHWQVSGETYVLILPQPGAVPDRWLALSKRAMKIQGTTWSFKDPLTGVWTKLVEPRDRIIRIWSPHPDEQTHADCAMRAALPICTEIEKTTQNIAARLDSRLAGNGIMWIPQEIDFPVAEGEQANAQSFMKLLMEAGEASLSDPGTAAAHVPIMAQVPGEYIAALADSHTDLATQMDGQVTELRIAALNRLGTTLEMAREIAMGQMSEANHWSGWQIEESTYKIHLEPPLLKLGMALVKEFFRPALVAMGETNPDRFVLAWDVTEIIARPDDAENDKYLYEQRLVSGDWFRSRRGVPDDAIPSDEEQHRRLAEALVLASPAVLDNPSVAEPLGFEAAPAPEPTIVQAPALEPEGNVRALPERQEQSPEPDAGLVAAAELIVTDALKRAGGRLLTPTYRGQFKDTPREELHTVIPLPQDKERLLDGSFQFRDNVARAFKVDPAGLRIVLTAYTSDLLVRSARYDRDDLVPYLRDLL